MLILVTCHKKIVSHMHLCVWQYSLIWDMICNTSVTLIVTLHQIKSLTSCLILNTEGLGCANVSRNSAVVKIFQGTRVLSGDITRDQPTPWPYQPSQLDTINLIIEIFFDILPINHGWLPTCHKMFLVSRYVWDQYCLQAPSERGGRCFYERCSLVVCWRIFPK